MHIVCFWFVIISRFTNVPTIRHMPLFKFWIRSIFLCWNFRYMFERWLPVDRHMAQGTYTTHRSRFVKTAGTLFNCNYIWYLNFTTKHALVNGSTQFQFSSQKGLNVSNIEMLEAFSVLFSGILSQSKILSKRYEFYHVALFFHFIFSLLVARLCGNLLWFL